MRGHYAERTEVPVEKTQGQIRTILEKTGAEKIGMTDGDTGAEVCFSLDGDKVRIFLPYPDRNSPQFSTTSTGFLRNPELADELWGQAKRGIWRAMRVHIKSRLDSVQCTGYPVWQEFMCDMVLPDGKTIREKGIGGAEGKIRERIYNFFSSI